MLLRRVYDNLWRSSECYSSDSSNPPPSALRPYGVQRGLCSLTLQLRPFNVLHGGSEGRTLALLQLFFGTAAFLASLTSKLSSNLKVLGSALVRDNEVACLHSALWDMECFHTHSTVLQNKPCRGTLMQHGVCM